MPLSSDDPFDEVLNLEERFYQEGYDEGYKDGAKAGRIEGISVGMKTGFEKFLEAGRLQGKAMVWKSRLPNLREQSGPNAESEESAQEPSANPQDEEDSKPRRLPPLNSNSRLEKNIDMLYGILEPGTLSTKNDDESVNDFDSRLKGAQARAKMIERAIGEGSGDKGSAKRRAQPIQKNENIEDIGIIPQRT